MSLLSFLLIIFNAILEEKSIEKQKTKYFEIFLLKDYLKENNKKFEVTFECKEYLREKVFRVFESLIPIDEMICLLLTYKSCKTIRRSTLTNILEEKKLLKHIMFNCIVISHKGIDCLEKLKFSIKEDFNQEFFSCPKFRIPKESKLALEVIRQTLYYDKITYEEHAEEDYIYFFGPFTKDYIENKIKGMALCGG